MKINLDSHKINQMKKILFFSLFIVGFLTIFQSCKTEEDVKNLGTINVDGVSYTINKGVVKGYKAAGPDATNKYTFTFTNIDGDQSKTLHFAISYPYNDISINGEYVLYGSSKQLDSWSSYYAETSGKHTDTYNNLVVGSIKVSRNSLNNFKVNFDIRPQAGQKIKGEFNGDAEVTE